MSDTVQMLKSAIRVRMRREREQMGSAARAAESRQICGHLIRWCAEQDIRELAAFLPFGTEADLYPFLDQKRRDCSIWVPRAERNGAEPVLRWAVLPKTGALPPLDWPVCPMGIAEPPEGETLSDIWPQAVLVPCLAVDRAGRRLGYGGGYYDWFLAGLPRTAIRVAVAFRVQMLDEALPDERHDVRMDAAVCGAGWFQMLYNDAISTKE